MVPLIGRARELARLAELLDDAAAGRGSVAVLSGEPGIGKSRIARELLALARSRGFLALSGTACPYQGGLSYAPVLEALRPLVAVDDPARARLVEGLTDLGRLFSGLPLPPATTGGDPSLERTRLFEAVSRLVQRVTATRPAVLLVDDLHWADPSSLDLLLYLSRSMTGFPCLIALAYRKGEAGEGLRAVLATLRRTEGLVELAVRPLDPGGVAALARSLLGSAPPSPLLGLLGARAQGIPLFVGALISSLVDSGELFRSGGTWVLGPGAGQDIPTDVAELMFERLDRLASADRTVIEAVSVCGDAATPDVLEAVCGDADLQARLAGLLGMGLLVEEPVIGAGGGTLVYRTSHPLLAEAAYSRLPELTRRRKHAQVAGALDREAARDLSRLAHHVGLAGPELEPQYALEVLAAAAELAVQRRAGAEGSGHAEAALALARATGQDDLVPVLLDRLALAATHIGRSDTAITAIRAAVAMPGAAPAATARRLQRLALAEWDRGAFADALGHLDRAAQLVDADDALDERLLVLQVRLILQNRAEGYGRIAADLAEVEAIAARTGHPRAVALGYVARLDLATASGDGTAPDDGFPAALDAARVLDDPELTARLYRPWMVTTLARGEHREATRRAEESLRQVRAATMPMLEVMPRFVIGFAAFQAGNWDDAMAAADAALVLAHRVGTRRGIAAALGLRAIVAVHRGELADAEEGIAEARDVFGHGDRTITRVIDTVAALLALARGDAARAVELAVPAGRRGSLGVNALTRHVAGEAQVAAGDRARALRTAAEMDDGSSPYCSAVAARLRGLAAGDCQVGSAAEWLAQATAGFDALAMPFDAAVCRLDWAEEVCATDADAAAAAAEPSVVVLDGLGARPAADRGRQLLRRLGRRPTARPRPPGELSNREMEIARLVADGLTNAAVAERLFISPRTVTSHLERIYRRLEIGSRAELTRFVRQLVT